MIIRLLKNAIFLLRSGASKAESEAAKAKKKAAPVSAKPKKEKTIPKSLSFYKADLDNINEIRNILTPHFDCSITPTLITRLALELMTRDEKKLIKACKEIRERDEMKS